MSEQQNENRDVPETKPIIKIENLRKIYRLGKEKVVALDGINLTINQGEICCLLGTSGSGKSTLLNMMAGLEKPTKGTVTIKGEAVEKMSEKKLAFFRQKNMGFVFQSYNLLPNLTAIDNVGLPLAFSGIPKQIRKKRSKEMLKKVGIANRSRHKPTQMSGGQQQRVGIARAFVGKPTIVFADEPTGNLDTKTTIEVMEMMVDMSRANNQTLIIVTHDNEIAVYADKIYHIIDGKIDKSLTKDDIKPILPIIMQSEQTEQEKKLSAIDETDKQMSENNPTAKGAIDAINNLEQITISE